MSNPRGVRLLVALSLIYLLFTAGRQILHEEGSPAFFVDSPGIVQVELGEGFDRPGIYQFSDGTPWKNVIPLTDLPCVSISSENVNPDLPMLAGQKLDLSCKGSNFMEFSFSWMRASKRMALAIPLQPDRMSAADWMDLPGIGPKLAEKIERDRQINGEFGTVETLARVPGIGPKRIDDWRGYFF